ncbi:hypothetical protein [Brevibacillus marinus]|uniref:hypothetical protein n=1 Tax=Brevibacillus marinus TaxID=2496837 RepID=UPI000F831243|nr:hypothetical protein [Brevibacillus marinus]
MKRKHAQWDIKTVFAENRIPKVDIARNVMEKIQSDVKQREAFFVRYKVGIVVCLAFLLMGTTGFAAMKAYQLKNEEGQVIYQEKDVTESGIPVQSPDEETEAFMSKLAEIEEDLQPGTAVAVYMKENNPKKRIVTLSKPFIYHDLPSLQQKLGNGLPVKAELPGGYVFEEAAVEYEVKREYNKEELYERAEKSNEEYVLQPQSFTDSILSLEISYRNGNDSLHVKMTPFADVENRTLFQAGMEQRKTEKIAIAHTEALYSEQAMKDGITKEIRWVQNVQGSPFLFMVETRAEQSNKDGLTQVMESLLGN